MRLPTITKLNMWVMKENTPKLKQISLLSFSGGIRNNGKKYYESLTFRGVELPHLLKFRGSYRCCMPQYIKPIILNIDQSLSPLRA